MKAYTDLEQSKKLAEILPLESADMFYADLLVDGVHKYNLHPLESYGFKTFEDTKLKASDHLGFVPCWSLAALLNYLREIDFFPDIDADEVWVTMSINYYNEDEAKPLAPIHNIKVKAESFIDACYEMIIKLHELNLI